jgi:hypothetical protein
MEYPNPSLSKKVGMSKYQIQNKCTLPLSHLTLGFDLAFGLWNLKLKYAASMGCRLACKTKSLQRSRQSTPSFAFRPGTPGFFLPE